MKATANKIDEVASEARLKTAEIKGRRNTTVVVAALGIGLTLVGAQLAREREQDRVANLLDRAVSNVAGILDSQIGLYESVLYEFRDRFAVGPPPSREEFHTLAASMLKRTPGILALEWAPLVLESERRQHEQNVREAGFPNYGITRLDTRGRLASAPFSPEYFPVCYLEPMAGNLRALGFDLSSGPTRDLLAPARAEADSIISPPIELVERPGTVDGLAVLQPVLSGLAEKYDPAKRNLAGYIQAVFRLPDVIAAMLSAVPDNELDILMYDAQAVPGPVLVYRSSGNQQVEMAAKPPPDFTGAHAQQAKLKLGERTWVLSVRATPAWLAARSSQLPLILLAAGFSLTGLAVTLVHNVARRADRIESKVALRTKELKEINERLEHQISEQRRVEGFLLNIQSTLLAAQRLGSTGSWEEDLIAGVLSWSDQVYRIFGRERSQFVPTNEAFFAAVHEDDRERVRAESARAVREGSFYHIEHRIRLPDRSVRHLEEHAEIARDPAGSAVRMIGAVRDVTSHRIAEAELNRERTLLRTIIDAIPDSIYVKDVSGRYVTQNRAHLEHHRLALDQSASAKTVFDFAPPDIAARYAADDCAVVTTGTPILNREEPFHTQAGDQGVWLTTKIALRDPTGLINGLVGISRDVTELKAVEKERLALDRHMQETARLESLGVLAGGIAHDFNNILTGILGNASLLHTSSGDVGVSSAARDIESAALRAAGLCRQMLAYAGKATFVIQEINLNRAVQQVSNLIRHSISKNTELVFDLSPGIPAVDGDATQLGQILMNLVINAAEAIGDSPGKITISTGIAFADRAYLSEPYLPHNLPEGNYVFVEVKDTGAGMTPDVRARIFEPFFTTKFAGRGLGLAASLGIIRAHHGALKVASDPGHGSSFRLLLPGKASVSATIEASSPSKPKNGKLGGCILVVDDEAPVRAVTRRMLELMGCEVIEAFDGEDGLGRFLADPERFHLVLLDLTMPKLNGQQVSQEIRTRRAELPIVFMSGYTEDAAAGLGLASDHVSFIQKPFGLQQLREKVEKMLGS